MRRFLLRLARPIVLAALQAAVSVLREEVRKAAQDVLTPDELSKLDGALDVAETATIERLPALLP